MLPMVDFHTPLLTRGGAIPHMASYEPLGVWILFLPGLLALTNWNCWSPLLHSIGSESSPDA
jgi:hypothetical protein